MEESGGSGRAPNIRQKSNNYNTFSKESHAIENPKQEDEELIGLVKERGAYEQNNYQVHHEHQYKEKDDPG